MGLDMYLYRNLYQNGNVLNITPQDQLPGNKFPGLQLTNCGTSE